MALRWKIFSFASGLLLLNLLQVTSGQYFTVGEKYYRVVTDQKVNWYRAFQTCSLLGMQLASIENASDMETLKTSLFSQSLHVNSYWLSGNNLANSGEYVWLSSGRRFAYTNWAPSQPTVGANRCVRSNVSFQWVADACTTTNYFICSKPLEPNCGVYGDCSNALTYLIEY